MDGKGLGCRITFLGCMGLVIFAFFGLLMNFTEGAAESMKVQRQREDVAQDLSMLLVASKDYATTHGGNLPPTDTPAAFKSALYPSLIAEEDRFVRFGDNAPYLPDPAVSGKAILKFRDPSNTAVLREPEGVLTRKKSDAVAPLTAYLDGTLR